MRVRTKRSAMPFDWGAVTGDENVNESCLTHEGAKGIGPKMDAPVRNQKEQVRRKQEFEGLDNHICGDRGASQEDR